MNKNYLFTWTDSIFAESKTEAKEKLFEIYAGEGYKELLETLFDEPAKEGTLNTGPIIKRIRKDA